MTTDATEDVPPLEADVVDGGVVTDGSEDAERQEEDGASQNQIEYHLLPVWRSLLDNHNAIDIGAHSGEFSAELAKSDFQVWSIEPNPEMFRVLSQRFAGVSSVKTLNVAVSDSRRVLLLNTVRFDGYAEDDKTSNALFSGLKKHPTFPGFAYEGTVNVIAWPLQKLAIAEMIPSEIGILKIDTEGSDPDIMRGMGALRPEIIISEYWSRDYVFNSGHTGNDVPVYVDILRPLGYNWHITIFHSGASEADGYLAGTVESPRGSWGNVIFFKSEKVYEASLQWLARSLEILDDPNVLNGLTSRFQMYQRRAAASAAALRGRISTELAAQENIARPLLRKRVDVLVSPNEVSSAHGTGILMTRLADGREGLVALRSQTTYGGRQDIATEAAFVLPNANMDRAEIVEQVARWLRPFDIDAITCVPYFETDLLIGLAVKSISGASMAMWIMDDHCLHAPGINREIMAEAIAQSNVVFAISPELKDAYEDAFGKRIHLLPPLVEGASIRDLASPVPVESIQRRQAVMIGNVWSQEWLEKLIGAIAESGWTVTWYTSNPDAFWLNFDRARVERSGLVVVEQPPMPEFIEAVSNAAFVVVPSAEVLDAGPAAAIARLSLPTRVPFVVATSGTPILVLGNPASAVSRFIRRFELGEVVDYSGEAFKQAAESLCLEERQRTIRHKAATLGTMFRSEGVYDYMRSAAQSRGYVADDRFERFFSPLDGEYSVYRETAIPPAVHPAFADLYECMSRLRRAGYRPDVVIDVGASTGIWSYYVSEVFSDARYLLIEPMWSRYPLTNLKPGFILEEKAAGAETGLITFRVSADLYNSSLVAISNVATETEQIEVEVTTVDDAVARHNLKGSALFKIDVQYAEHLVLAGATETLKKMADFVLLELTFDPPVAEAKNFVEMMNLMDGLGFRPFDDVGGWRSPQSGFSDQKDVLFVRHDFSFPAGG